jgi:hypothetical protein
MPMPLTGDAIPELLRVLPRVGAEANMSDALHERDWHRVLALAPKNFRDVQTLVAAGEEMHNISPEDQGVLSPRWDAFSAISDYLDDTEYWVLLGRCWVECEKAVDEAGGRVLFEPDGRDVSLRYLMMDELERRVLNSLPDRFNIFRGGRLGGWCWSYKLHLADGFKDTEDAIVMTDAAGNPLPPEGGDDAVGMHTRWCKKQDVVAVFLRKGECEVVVNWNTLEPLEVDDAPHEDRS